MANAISDTKPSALTMADISMTAGESYAKRRSHLESSKAHHAPSSDGVSWSSGQDELVFGLPGEHLFPWEVPDGVTWLEYLFGTHIQMTQALFPDPIDDVRGDPREIVLQPDAAERIEEIALALRDALPSPDQERGLDELATIKRLASHVGLKFSERTYAKGRTGEALAP